MKSEILNNLPRSLEAELKIWIISEAPQNIKRHWTWHWKINPYLKTIAKFMEFLVMCQNHCDPDWKVLQKSSIVCSPGHSCCRTSAKISYQQKILNQKWVHIIKIPTLEKKPSYLTTRPIVRPSCAKVSSSVKLWISSSVARARHSTLPRRRPEVSFAPSSEWSMMKSSSSNGNINTNVAVHHGFTSHKKAKKYQSSGCTLHSQWITLKSLFSSILTSTWMTSHFLPRCCL